MSLLSDVQASRSAMKSELDRINAAVESRASKKYTDAESRRFDHLLEEVRGCDQHIAELQESESMQAAANASYVATQPGAQRGSSPDKGMWSTTGTESRRRGGWSVMDEPEVYRDPWQDNSGPSFFRDLLDVKFGGPASERLNRNHAAQMEKRAGDMTTVAGAGGQFAPPAWLVEEFVALARPGRVAANLAVHDQLPSGFSSVNLPKVAGGATTGVQQTQNSALSDTAMTTTSVSSSITTIGGKQIVSMQLLRQSSIPFDRVILQDLANDCAKQVDQQFLYGTNANGQLNGLVNVANNTAFTTASPALTSATAANSFYNKIIAAAAAIATARYDKADAVIMHPNRWAWCLEALDSQVRPIIAADGAGFNNAGVSTESVAQGSVGTIAKIPVYIDPGISLTANSATNQDEVYVLRSQDIYLWESELLLESFDATYADNASVLFRALAFAALIPNRYTASIGVIRGTGLVAPTL